MMKLHEIKSPWSFIIYRSHSIYLSTYLVILSMKTDLITANSAHSDEMSHIAAFHLGALFL